MNKKFKLLLIKNLDKIILLSIVLFAIYVRLHYFVGVNRFDSFFYAQLSYFISQLDFHSFFFDNSNYFAIGRLLLFLPTGLAYHFFGVRDISSVLFALLASIANIIVVYFLGKTLMNKWVGLIAAYLLAIHPLDVIYATQSLPDGLIPFFLSSSVLSFLYAEKEVNSKRIPPLYLLTGIFLGFAQYVRENAFIFVSVFIVYLLIKRHIKREYAWIFVGGLLVFSLAGLFFLFGTGDFFYNFGKFFARVGVSNVAVGESFGDRIAWLVFTKILFLDILFRTFSLLLLISIVFSLSYLRREIAFIMVWFFVILIYLDLISPLHGLGKQDRYLSILTVPSVIIIASTITTIFKGYKRGFIVITLLLFLVTVSAKAAVEIARPQTVQHPHFVTYKALAKSLEGREIKKIYVNNLEHKGYIFNYVLDFDSLDYNSFQRDKVEGTKSLMINWDGLKSPEKGSFVVVDSEELYKKVKPNWKLVSKKFTASLYLVE